MTHPKDPQAELRKAIKQILQPLAASAASKSLHLNNRRAYRLKAERELVALFQAREQQLLTELLGELPEKLDELPHNNNPMWDNNKGFNQAISQVVSVIEARMIKPYGVGLIKDHKPIQDYLDKPYQNKTREGL